MEQPKFILTNRGYLRLGMVRMHKDLLRAGEACYGGGFYEFDYVGNQLILSGSSFDFGPPKWSWIDRLKVPAAYKGLAIVYVAGQEDYVVSDEMEIEYID
ncbi:MAG: hypothetical protein LUC23_05300 [Prevotellaceae bacterium]|nr:hypothetical protein [Prevotellaceae bacterium]